MKIISFSEGQSGEEWHKWRKNGIGASDISAVMRSNPYTTRLQLWEKKCEFRADDPMNSAMEHGIKTEDIARQWLNEHEQLHLKPVCIEDPEIPYFRASLDGYDFDQKVLVEIKCPVSEATLDKARDQQIIPDYWYDQMQWQIMMCEPKNAFIALWDFRHSCCITLDMFGNTKRIKEMREKGKEFWHLVQIGKAPEAEKGDYIEVEDDNLHALLLEYQDLGEKEKGYSERRKEVKKQIEEFGDDGNFTAYGFKIQRVAPSPRYDIDQMKLDGIDVDRYVKKSDSIGWYRIIPPKSKK